MDYYKLTHDGTIIRVENDRQQKYVKGKGWVYTRILNTFPHTEIKQRTAQKKIRALGKEG
jgi:hypothetical protein